jgi:hypothetical protein
MMQLLNSFDCRKEVQLSIWKRGVSTVRLYLITVIIVCASIAVYYCLFVHFPYLPINLGFAFLGIVFANLAISYATWFVLTFLPPLTFELGSAHVRSTMSRFFWVFYVPFAVPLLAYFQERNR